MNFDINFYRFSVMTLYHLVLSHLRDDVARDDGQAMPNGGSDSELQLPKFTYGYLAADFKLEDGS